jgi:hypothetical protein
MNPQAPEVPALSLKGLLVSSSKVFSRSSRIAALFTIPLPVLSTERMFNGTCLQYFRGMDNHARDMM